MRQFALDDAARYTPAVNDAYARVCSSPISHAERALPAGFSAGDLAFWEPTNRYFHYPFALHSVGLYTVGTRIDNALTRSSKAQRTLIGDSGGFQLGGQCQPFGYKPLVTGISASEAMRAWHEAEELRDWIIGYLTGSCNMGMTIDVPLWANTPSKEASAFHSCSPTQLITLNRHTLDYIERSTPLSNEFRWLNVIQGLDRASIDDWIAAVHHFRHGGWALGGEAGVRGGVANVLYTVNKLRAIDAFCDGNTWIHVLGVGTAEWAVYLSEIQRCLRQNHADVTVSFDNATPFSQAARYERMMRTPQLAHDMATWSMRFEVAPQGQIFTQDATPFCTESAIGRDLTRAMLNSRDELYNPNKFDQVSHSILANHNVYVMLDTFERANWIAVNEPHALPQQITDTIQMIRTELGG